MSDSHNSTRSFKLIGLRVMEDCSRMLCKVLHPETTYFFCNDFEDDGQGYIQKVAGVQELSQDFFSGQSSFSPYVNMTCVVGQNGDGKSSVIELLIRTINNFAYMAGFLSDYSQIKFIPGLYTKLFFLVDGEICAINANGMRMEMIVNKTIVWERDLNTRKDGREHVQKKRVIKYSAKLFYMLVSNYSLYAYNSKEFKIETSDKDDKESWIASLFNKNDAYQTPIAIFPMRERGIIDINREHGLTLQHLSELFLDCSKGKYRISDTEIVEGFAFKLKKESKLFSKTLRSYFCDEQKGARDSIILKGSFNKNKYAINLKEETVIEENIKFWQQFDHEFYDTGLLNIAKSIIGGVSKKEKPSLGSGTGNLTDLSKYLNTLRGISFKGKSRNWETAKKNIERFIDHGGAELSFLQFQRLFLVFEVFKYWRAYLKRPGLAFPFAMTKNLNGIEHAFCYLIYKTIRVLENYPEYLSGSIENYEYPQHFFNERVRKNTLTKWFDSLDSHIQGKAHFTVKIRQTLLFLEKDGKLLSSSVKKYPTDIASQLTSLGLDYYLDVNEYYKRIHSLSDPAACVPPPFYQVDFLISRDMSLYPLSRMSSGERQRLFSSSSIVYHLRNIFNSQAKATKITYKNIIVVLEEVELYFHPEYQRGFVQYLLNQIMNAHLTSNMAINLVFVTHSPFILSDIPRQNVLFLKGGRPDRSMQEDTFGANIHTLLQNGFFLNSVPIGEFAKNKINRMFSVLNQSGEISADDMNRLEVEIPLVSEPLLRNQLMRLFSQRKCFQEGDYQRKVQELESRIAYLESKLYDKN